MPMGLVAYNIVAHMLLIRNYGVEVLQYLPAQQYPA